MKEIKNLINNKNCLIKEPNKGDIETPCMDVHKQKIMSDVSLDTLKLRIAVSRYLQNTDVIGDTWYPIASTRTLKYFLEDEYQNK